MISTVSLLKGQGRDTDPRIDLFVHTSGLRGEGGKSDPQAEPKGVRLLLTQWGWEGVPLQWAQLEQRPEVTQPGRLPGPLGCCRKRAGHRCIGQPWLRAPAVSHSLLSLKPESVFPLIAEGQRSATSQAMHQLFALFVTLTFASVGGAWR